MGKNESLDSRMKEEQLVILENKAAKENMKYETFQEFIESQDIMDSDLPPKGMENVELMFLLGKEWAGESRKAAADGDEQAESDAGDGLDDIWDDWDESDDQWYEKHRNTENWEEEEREDEGWKESDVWNGVWGAESDDPAVTERRKRIDELWDSCIDRALGQMVEQQYAARPRKFARHRFSLPFQWKMAKMIRAFESDDREKKETSRSLPKIFRPLRSARVAVAMAAVTVALLGTTVRGTNPIIVWMYKTWMVQHGDYVEIEGRDDEEGIADHTSDSFKKYELTKVPEGYELQDEMYDEILHMNHLYYVNADGQLFALQQGEKDNKILGNVTANRKDMEKVTVGGFEGYFIKDSDINNLILSDDETILLFIGAFSKEELLELARNLRAVE